VFDHLRKRENFRSLKKEGKNTFVLKLWLLLEKCFCPKDAGLGVAPEEGKQKETTTEDKKTEDQT